MQSSDSAAVLNQDYIWRVLPTRFGTEIDTVTLPLWEKVGLFNEYGSFGIYFTGEDEGEEIKKELVGILLRAMEALRLQRVDYLRRGRGVGRPPDPMIVRLGQELIALYLRYHDFGGRHSVVTTVDGKSVQKESGPLLEFVTQAIEPLDRVLVEELHRKPLSPARVLRAGLRARLDPP
jgi:hypothetical protein